MENYLALRTGEAFRLGAGITVEFEAEIFQALCTFLTENKLITKDVPNLSSNEWEGFELRVQDLTDEGLELAKTGLTKWMMAIDRGRPPGNISLLKKYLEKLRRNADTS